MGAFLAGLMVLLRGWAHPEHTLDLEGTFVAIAGRQLSQGHVADVAGYQIDWYRGEPLVDGALAALGFLAFGDHLLAWLWLTAGYVVVGALLASTLLRRLGNPVGAALFGFLLALAAPVALHDGLASNTVGHAATPVWALLAALPLVPPEGKPGWGRGLLGGALLGFAIWYQRTAVLAVPALAVLASVGGVRGLVGFGLGLSSFPLLVLGNAAVLQDVGGRRADDGFRAVVERSFFGVEGGNHGERNLLRQLMDPVGLGLERLLNAPAPREQLGWTRAPGRLLAQVWPLACLVGGGFVLRAGRGDRRRLLPLLLALGWTLGYALTSFEAEPVLWDLVQSEESAAPTPSDTRYLIPSFVLWAWVLAAGLGSWRRDGPRPRLSLLLAGLLVLLGLPRILAGLDRDPRAAAAWSASLPWEYVGVYGHWVGPTRHLHAECTRGDAICRAHHLRTLGAWGEPSLEVLGQDSERTVAGWYREATAELGAEGREARFVAHGMGIEIGTNAGPVVSPEDAADFVENVRDAAEDLPDEAAHALLMGVSERLRPRRWVPRAGEVLEALCASPSTDAIEEDGERPLCASAAVFYAPEDFVTPQRFAARLRVQASEDFDPEDAAVAIPELMRGYGRLVGRQLPPDLWPAADGLDPALRGAWEDGLRTGGRIRWRIPEAELGVAEPWHHP